jgi:hypothetical protein
MSASGSTSASDLSSGTLAITRMAAGTVLRSFYDESTGSTFNVSGTAAQAWSEMDITIAGTNDTSDFLQITMFFSSMHNNSAGGRFIELGARYSTDDWSGNAQFGSEEFYDRPLYHSTSDGIVESATVVIRAAHPTTSTYRIRPWIIGGATTAGNFVVIGQSNHYSTMTAHEIKG